VMNRTRMERKNLVEAILSYLFFELSDAI